MMYISILAVLSGAAISLANGYLLRQWSVPSLESDSGKVVGSFTIAVNKTTTLVLGTQTCSGAVVSIQHGTESEFIESSLSQVSTESSWMGSSIELSQGLHYFNYTTSSTVFGASRLTARILQDKKREDLAKSKYRVISLYSSDLLNNKDNRLISREQANQICDQYENRVLADVNSDNLPEVAEVLRSSTSNGPQSAMINSWNGVHIGGPFVVKTTGQSTTVNVLQMWDIMKNVICESQTAHGASVANAGTTNITINDPVGVWDAYCATCLKMGKTPAILNGINDLQMVTEIVYAFYKSNLEDNLQNNYKGSIKVWLGGWNGEKAAGPLVFVVKLTETNELVPGTSGFIASGSPLDQLQYLCQAFI